MSKPFMFIQAPVATRSGYGAHSRDIVQSLIDMDKFEIKIMKISIFKVNLFHFFT